MLTRVKLGPADRLRLFSAPNSAEGTNGGRALLRSLPGPKFADEFAEGVTVDGDCSAADGPCAEPVLTPRRIPAEFAEMMVELVVGAEVDGGGGDGGVELSANWIGIGPSVPAGGAHQARDADLPAHAPYLPYARVRTFVTAAQVSLSPLARAASADWDPEFAEDPWPGSAYTWTERGGADVALPFIRRAPDA